MTQKETTPGPVAGRAATVRPDVDTENRQDRAPGEASPGAAEDKAQAEKRSD